MSLITAPETIDVEEMTTTQKQVDTYRAISIVIYKNPNDLSATSLVYTWARGYMSGETFVSVEERVTAISLDVLGQFMLAAPDASCSTFEEDFKKRLWAAAREADPTIPIGVVE